MIFEKNKSLRHKDERKVQTDWPPIGLAKICLAHCLLLLSDSSFGLLSFLGSYAL